VRNNDRLMLVKVVQKEVINIISAYAPQSNCSQEEKDLFIAELETLARAVPQTERLVIGADMNGQVGADANGYEGIHGGYGYGVCNEEGNIFLEMVQGLDMIVVNTCFRKSEEHRITYRSGPSASQIDYFTVRQADRKYVKDCTVIPGEAAVKQHRILVMDMRIRSVKTGYRPKQQPLIRNWKLKGENLAKFKCEVQQKMNNQEVTWDKLKHRLVLWNQQRASVVSPEAKSDKNETPGGGQKMCRGQ